MASRKTARTAAEYVPADADLPRLVQAARSCRGCDLYRAATQTVFGAGDADARVVLVGEQPGDQEDRQGLPFVGPAGRLLDRALDEAGIDRADCYVTNAVKHFKFVPAERGKRRLHKTPSRAEVVACRPWLEAELRALEPELLVCLGATAAKAVFGSAFKVTEQRGRLLSLPDELAQQLRHPEGEDRGTEGPTPAERAVPEAMATIHPSAALRAENRDEVYAGLVADLRVAASALT